MKIINKNNGRTIAEGRFELSKVSDIGIYTRMGDDTWIIFRYFCDNLIKKQGDYNFLDMVAEITVKDNLISIEASGEDCVHISEIIALVQLTTEEREHLFVHLINHILGKDI